MAVSIAVERWWWATIPGRHLCQEIGHLIKQAPPTTDVWIHEVQPTVRHERVMSNNPRNGGGIRVKNVGDFLCGGYLLMSNSFARGQTDGYGSAFIFDLQPLMQSETNRRRFPVREDASYEDIPCYVRVAIPLGSFELISPVDHGLGEPSIGTSQNVSAAIPFTPSSRLS